MFSSGWGFVGLVDYLPGRTFLPPHQTERHCGKGVDDGNIKLDRFKHNLLI